MNRSLAWTSNEIIRLRKLYPTTPLKVLAREFPCRSLRAIEGAARRHNLSKIIYRKPRKNRDWKAIAANHKPVIFSGVGEPCR